MTSIKQINYSVLKSFSFGSCLENEELIFLFDSGNVINIDKNKKVFYKGQNQKYLFFLISGTVKLTSSYEDGKDAIKQVVSDSNLLNVLGLAGDEFHKDNAIVLSSEAILLQVELNVFNNLMTQKPKLAFCVIQQLGRKLNFAESRVESLALHDAKTRILDFIKSNAILHGKQMGSETLLKHEFTQQDIADYTGTTRQTVTTILNDLKKDNKIFMKRKSILIRNMENF